MPHSITSNCTLSPSSSHYSPPKKIQEERAHTTPLKKKVVLIQEAHGEWNKYLAIFRKQNLPFLENTTFHGQV